MKALRGTFRRDEGMTLVEIMVATVILFFAITAVLGLIAASTRVNVQATQQVLVVNRVQSYIESVRGMSWEEIGVAGGAVPGSLPTSSHFVEAGYEVTITPTITWVDDPRTDESPDYKMLRVVAVSRPSAGGTEYSYTAETYIRESDANRPDDAAPPEVEFASGSPEVMQVISGTSVSIYALASSPMENGLLQNLRFYCDGRTLRNSSLDGAEWPLEEKSVTRSFAWDTTVIDVDGLPFSPDGVRQIKIQAWDNVGQTTYRIRQVIVDNYAPDPVGSVTAEPRTNLITGLSWPYSMDGPTVSGVAYATDPSAGYRIQRKVESASGSWTDLPVENVGNVTSIEHASTAFSRYDASVTALSPSGKTSAPTAVIRPYISRSLLRGTFTNTYTGKNDSRYCMSAISFILSAPTFGYSSINNVLYRSTSPDMAGATPVQSGTGFTGSNSYLTLVGRSGAPTAYYYQVISLVRPSGLPSGASNPVETVKSNIIGPVSTATSGIMPTAGW